MVVGTGGQVWRLSIITDLLNKDGSDVKGLSLKSQGCAVSKVRRAKVSSAKVSSAKVISAKVLKSEGLKS